MSGGESGALSDIGEPSSSVLLFFGICFSAMIFSQTEKEIEHKVHFWTSINSTMRLHNHWGVMGDFHIRRGDIIKDPNFYFLRIGGVYWINDKISLAGGGAVLWLANIQSDETYFSLERRVFQQLLWRSVNGKARFLQRVEMSNAGTKYPMKMVR